MGAEHLPDLSFVGRVGTFLAGSVRIGPAKAGGRPLLALGPLTVDPSFERKGIGSALMRTGIDAARTAGHGLIVLVGDMPYYGRFGFTPVPGGKLALPGPVDPARFLWLELADDAKDGASGIVTGGLP